MDGINLFLEWAFEDREHSGSIIGYYVAHTQSQKIRDKLIAKLYKYAEKYRNQALFMLKRAAQSTKNESTKKAILEKFPNLLDEEEKDNKKY